MARGSSFSLSVIRVQGVCEGHSPWTSEMNVSKLRAICDSFVDGQVRFVVIRSAGAYNV